MLIQDVESLPLSSKDIIEVINTCTIRITASNIRLF